MVMLCSTGGTIRWPEGAAASQDLRNLLYFLQKLKSFACIPVQIKLWPSLHPKFLKSLYISTLNASVEEDTSYPGESGFQPRLKPRSGHFYSLICIVLDRGLLSSASCTL